MSDHGYTEVAQLIDASLSLLESVPEGRARAPATKRGLPDLLDRCQALVGAAADEPRPVMRTVHHLSCTGGTLFAKCLAAMPNVLLLNEVDPLSKIRFSEERPEFTPTDTIALVRQGDPRISEDVLVGMFLADMDYLGREEARGGRAVVLRDHSHSHFLFGDDVPARSTLREMLLDRFEVRSVLTVRDPIDSYLSMSGLGWHNLFSPSSLDEYCRRYEIFLDRYAGIEIVRYEDFVADSKGVMSRVCATLDLTYSDEFTDLFGVMRFSGDSGRSSNTIGSRSRRTIPTEIADMAKASHHYRRLAEILHYEPI
jgi:hypothetical protein